MQNTSTSVGNLIDQLERLPGIGRKSAERLAYHLLRVSQGEAMALAEAIRHVRQNVRYLHSLFQQQRTNCVLSVAIQPRSESTLYRRTTEI